MELIVELSAGDGDEITKTAALLRCSPSQLASLILTCPPVNEMLSDESNLRWLIEELASRYPAKQA